MHIPKPHVLNGFTLIELSIVLVIIGLIAGGVLIGRHLIVAGGVQATITQLQAYQSAANAFSSQYNALPGDIPDPTATNFGFVPRGHYAGGGDGNGTIEGNWWDAPNTNGNAYQFQGETCMFWVDLGTAKMMEGGLTTCQPASSTIGTYSLATVDLLLPQAKIGRGNHIYVWGIQHKNYMSIAAGLPGANGTAVPGLTTTEAYSIDKKIDDGLPQSGDVQAFYLQNFQVWYAGTTTGQSSTAAVVGSATSCFDNGGVDGNAQQYSVRQNGGNGVNCALSFELAE